MNMNVNITHRLNQRVPGVTLAELAIYLALAAIVIAGAVSAYNVAFSGVDKTEIRNDIVAISVASKAYRAEKNIGNFHDNGSTDDDSSSAAIMGRTEWGDFGNLLPQRLHDGEESEIVYEMSLSGELTVEDESGGGGASALTLTADSCTELETYFDNTAGDTATASCAPGILTVNLANL